MKLKKVILNNFRGYEKLELELDGNLNIIIGQNDVGKSTVLEALEIFFNNETVKMEIEDLNVKAEEPIMRIGLVFEVDLTKEYLLDSSTKTKLQDEYLLNEDGYLEIYKEWDCSKGKITATNLNIYLNSYYIKHYSKKPLIEAKIAELRTELGKYKEQISNYDDIHKSTSSDIRKALYGLVDNKECCNVNIQLKKEDGKKIYESLCNELPMYFLFQSDRANRDTDKEVQDPLKAITKLAISEVKDTLDEIKDQIEEKAKQIGIETLEKLKEMAPEIADVLKPEISNKAWESLFSFSFVGDDNIPINKRGSGVRRLILLNYFRAEADRKNVDSRNVIYAIEEPETSQHPKYQHMLFEALEELGNQDNHQVIITTHTPEIAKMGKESNLILLSKIDEVTIPVEGEDKLLRISNTLGLLPYYSKLVVCLEGENDISFLKGINNGIDELKSIISLEETNISLIPMAGSNLKNWIQRHYLKDSNVIEFHLYDRDTNEQYKSSIDKVNRRTDGSHGMLSKNREMENYIHYSLIEKEFNISCDSIKNNWFNEDIPVYISEKCKHLKETDIKSIINGKLSKKMTKELAEEMGIYEEMKTWFSKIKELHVG